MERWKVSTRWQKRLVRSIRWCARNTAIKAIIQIFCAKEVAFLNRTEEKAAVIAEDVNRHLQSKAAYAMKLSDYGKLTGENYVVIQTTSVGLYPNCDDAVIEDEDFYKRAAETKFMKLMKAQGKPAYNGLKMLLYQGVSAFELWNDIKISKENIRKVYENMQKKLG